ncbi:MAG TPA: fibronectin type III domain-containing protein, partial [Vicinamibacterales bacterium]|nr:fibronectin type III domain-containing protein [Vicinamibacterales bacterium]
PGAAAPPNREFLTPKYVVGAIQVRPPEVEGAPPAADERRPAAGDVATFTETLDEATLRPQFTEPPQAPPGTDPAATAPEPAPLSRIYAIRGVARNGRPGQPSPRLVVPLAPAPAAPGDVAADFTETAIQLSWTPPSQASTPAAFNVYPAGGETPLNTTPLTGGSFERPGVEFGREECFVVRSVVVAGNVSIESAPSPQRCVTPVDTFAPAAPTGLAAVAAAGGINLIWNANSEADLAGYLVLRGEAPGETLQPVTQSPVRETTYRDTSVKPGVRYVYAIVAVDRATPPNMSAQSLRVEETAR